MSPRRLVRTLRQSLSAAPGVLVGALLFALPLALGGAFPWAPAVAAVVMGIAFFAHALTCRLRDTRVAFHGFGLLLLALGGAALLQTLPLPIALVQWVSPNAALWHQQAATLLGETATTATLSVDAVATWSEAARWFALALAFLFVFHTSLQSEQHAGKWLSLVAWSGALVLVTTAVQTAVGQGVWFGLYEPQTTNDLAVLQSTFINENHLAGFLNLTGFVALGLSQHAEDTKQRVLYGTLFSACMAGTAFSMSRGGVASAVAAVALYMWLSVSHRRSLLGRRRGGPRLIAFASVTLLLAGVALAAYLGLTYGFESIGVLQGAAADIKFQIMGQMPELLRDYPFFGVGAGAIGDAFSSYNHVAVGLEVTHAESMAIDLAVQYGLPVAVAVLGWTLFLLAGPFLRATRNADTLGAVVGVYALVLQNFVDFSLFLVGVALPATVVIAAVVGLDSGERRELSPRSLSRRRWPAWAAATVALVAMGVAGVGIRSAKQFGDLAIDEFLQERAAAAAATPQDDERFASFVRLRPADPHMALIEAVHQLQRGDHVVARRWLDGARARAPRAFGPLLLEARISAVEGDRDKAVALYRECFELHEGRRDDVIRDAHSVLGTAKEFDRMVPDDEELFRWTVLRLKSEGQFEFAEAILQLRLASRPDAYWLRWELALLMFQRNAEDAEIDSQASQLMARHPTRAGGFLVQGMLFQRSESWPQALVMFEEADSLEPTNPHALLGMSRSFAELEQYEDFREVVGRLRPLVRDDAQLRSELLEIRAKVSRSTGRLEDAAMELEMAVAAAPRSPRLLAGLGEAKAALHDQDAARTAFERALEIAPDYSRARNGLELLERKHR